MKSYWEIPGPSKMPQSHCIAFYKYDGSQIRALWQRKGGWVRFGTRHCLIDEKHEQFGDAVGVFKNTYGDDLAKLFKESKEFRGLQEALVFCEYFGKGSFAGTHVASEPKEVVMFDVNLHKKGFVLPRDFVKQFGHLKTPEVIYEGNFNQQFIQDIKESKYPVYEGVVVKGVIEGKKSSSQHGLWMAKVKTHQWMDDLKSRASTDAEFRKALADNEREQV